MRWGYAYADLRSLVHRFELFVIAMLEARTAGAGLWKVVTLERASAKWEISAWRAWKHLTELVAGPYR